MGTTGPARTCAAQIVLDNLKRVTITPQELGDMLDIHHIAAAWILRNLGWDHETFANRSVLYHQHGAQKDFNSSSTAKGRVMAKRILRRLQDQQGEIWRRLFSLEAITT